MLFPANGVLSVFFVMAQCFFIWVAMQWLAEYRAFLRLSLANLLSSFAQQLYSDDKHGTPLRLDIYSTIIREDIQDIHHTSHCLLHEVKQCHKTELFCNWLNDHTSSTFMEKLLSGRWRRLSEVQRGVVENGFAKINDLLWLNTCSTDPLCR